jgi:hypothetical protein
MQKMIMMRLPVSLFFLLLAVELPNSSCQATLDAHSAVRGKSRNEDTSTSLEDTSFLATSDDDRSFLLRSIIEQSMDYTEEAMTDDFMPDDYGRELLQSNISSPIPCNKILFEWTIEETKAAVASFVNRSLPQKDVSYLLDQVTFGIRAQKICAACTDFPDLAANASFCHSHVYGSNVANSGLVYLPLQPSPTDSSKLVIAPGTRIPAIYCHGTRTSGEMSQEATQGNLTLELWQNVIITATRGTLSILPDYMGYGSSSGIVYKAYLIRQAYATASVPLVWRTRQLVEQQTGCATAMANAVVVSGYSEGGYASAAIADALNSAGLDVIQLMSGGGPYAIASTQLLFTTQQLEDHTYAVRNYPEIALFGSAYSSTYKNLPNYGKQNYLSNRYRDKIVHMVNTTNVTSQELGSFLNVTAGGALNVVNYTFASYLRKALAVNNTEPCAPQTPLKGQPRLLCQALLEQDLTQTLLSVRYPVKFCHSMSDTLVAFGNVPNISLNPDYLSAYIVPGSHLVAEKHCLAQFFMFFMQGMGGYQIPQNVVCSSGGGGGGGNETAASNLSSHSPSPFLASARPSTSNAKQVNDDYYGGVAAALVLLLISIVL